MENDKSKEPYFQLTILGCSGGPIDGKTCSFLLKPSKISYYDIILNSINDCVIGLDAGTGISGVSDLILSKLNNLRFNADQNNERNYLLDLYLDSLPIKDYNLNDKIRFNDLSLVNLMQDYKLSPIEISVRLINLISSYLITHVHLDHVSGLVINSPVFQQNSNKLIYGSEFTINSLKENLFNDKVWPSLYSNSKGSLVHFKIIEKDEDVSMDVLENTTKEITDENNNNKYHKINNNEEKWIELNRYFKVKYFEINHGLINNETVYNSTAYLIKSIETSKLLLMFGDVESDFVSKVPKNYLIWKYISKYILNKSLSHIIIECSSVNLPPGVPLYGHMTPKNLFYELNSLRRQCYKYLILNRNAYYDGEGVINFNEIESVEELGRMSDAELSRLEFQPLKDLSLLIIHVKETFSMEPLNEREVSPFNRTESFRATSQNSPSPSSVVVATSTSISKPTPNSIHDHISPLSSNSSSLLGKSISSESSQSSFDSFHSTISSDTSYNSDNNIGESYNNLQLQQNQQLFNNSYYNNSGANRVMSPLPFERNREESTSSNSTFTSNCSVSTSKNQSNLKLSQSHPTFTNINSSTNAHSNNNSTSSTNSNSNSNNEFNNTGCCKSCSNREFKKTGNLCCGGTRGSEPRKEILSELTELNELYNLGVLFTITLPGLNYIL
ncbi:unnamed protein product [[Candida] boidinii]|nr:unnamed protein product [[Candida] boidinii]